MNFCDAGGHDFRGILSNHLERIWDNKSISVKLCFSSSYIEHLHGNPLQLKFNKKFKMSMKSVVSAIHFKSVVSALSLVSAEMSALSVTSAVSLVNVLKVVSAVSEVSVIYLLSAVKMSEMSAMKSSSTEIQKKIQNDNKKCSECNLL